MSSNLTQEIKVIDVDGQTQSATISDLPVEMADELTTVFTELLDGLPQEAYQSVRALEKAMRDGLTRRLADLPRESAARYKFEFSSGKLTLPRLGRIGALEISGGELDTYKVLRRIAFAAAACHLAGCKDIVAHHLGLANHK